jgi:hypothetical protein
MTALEQIEVAAWSSLVDAAPRALVERMALSRREIEGATRFRSRLPAPELNRMLGMAAIGDAHVAALEPGMLLQAPPPLVDAARARGLTARSTWVKLVRRASAPGRAPALEVREVGAADAARFAETFCQAYELPPALAPWHAALVGRPGWRAYVVLDGGAAIASALLFHQGDLAWLGAAATLRAHRGKGAQKALIARRLADAAAAGAAEVVSETSLPAPDAKNPSLDNLRAAGFAIAYERVNFVLRETGARTGARP